MLWQKPKVFFMQKKVFLWWNENGSLLIETNIRNGSEEHRQNKNTTNSKQRNHCVNYELRVGNLITNKKPFTCNNLEESTFCHYPLGRVSFRWMAAHWIIGQYCTQLEISISEISLFSLETASMRAFKTLFVIAIFAIWIFKVAKCDFPLTLKHTYTSHTWTHKAFWYESLSLLTEYVN